MSASWGLVASMGCVVVVVVVVVVRPMAKSLISDIEFLISLRSRFKADAFLSDVDEVLDDVDDDEVTNLCDFFSTLVVVLLFTTYQKDNNLMTQEF